MIDLISRSDENGQLRSSTISSA